METTFGDFPVTTKQPKIVSVSTDYPTLSYNGVSTSWYVVRYFLAYKILLSSKAGQS